MYMRQIFFPGVRSERPGPASEDFALVIVMKTKTISTAVVLLLIVGSCCRTKKPVEEWTMRPVALWTAVSTAPIHPVRNGYRILVPQPTEGIFPATLAITAVAIEDPALGEHEDGDAGAGDITVAGEPYLPPHPKNEFLDWNSALDNLMAVSEVFPIVSRDLGGGTAEPEQILAAFRALHGKLGVIYAANELSRTQTEMFGVLYHVDSGDRLASLHAEAWSENPDPNTPGDLWVNDSRAIARVRFAEILHACIRDLILNDKPAQIETPTGWTPTGPVRPVEWPPRSFGTGR